MENPRVLYFFGSIIIYTNINFCMGFVSTEWTCHCSFRWNQVWPFGHWVRPCPLPTLWMGLSYIWLGGRLTNTNTQPCKSIRYIMYLVRVSVYFWLVSILTSLYMYTTSKYICYGKYVFLVSLYSGLYLCIYFLISFSAHALFVSK